MRRFDDKSVDEGAESMKSDHPCFRASLKLSFANQVLKDTILELLRKRKPGSSC